MQFLCNAKQQRILAHDLVNTFGIDRRHTIMCTKTHRAFTRWVPEKCRTSTRPAFLLSEGIFHTQNTLGISVTVITQLLRYVSPDA
ncbi:putative IS2 ORF [Shigella flexneri]|nr:putative IS2 ORF [Shigella flexneri]